MDNSDSRFAFQEPAVDAGHVAFLGMIDGLESLVAASPIDLAPDTGGRANSLNQAPRQLGANRLLMSKSCHRFSFKSHEIHGCHRYRNEYQTALDRILPDKTATHGFLEKPQKKTAKTGLKCPIPTFAAGL
jgi:hypothetical protein